MKILNLIESEVLKQAQVTFADKFVELTQTDFFLDDIEKGEIHIDGIDYPLYINTHYVYEDHLVNNNKTRYKVHITCVLVKESPYEVIYDSRGKYYVAYEEDGIQFVLYEDFQKAIQPFIHEKEAK
ncbi:MAG: hypothetical protein RR531_07795 [Longicatena sp.]